MRAHRPPPPRRERSRGRYVGHPKPRGSSHRVSPGPPCKRQTRGRRSFEPHLQRASTVHRTGGSPVSQITSHCNPVGCTSCWTRLVAPNCWEGEGSRPEILDHLSSSAMAFAFWLDWASQRLNADYPLFAANTAWTVSTRHARNPE